VPLLEPLEVVVWLLLEVVVWLLLVVVVLLPLPAEWVFDAAGLTAGLAVRAGRFFGLGLGGGFGLGLGGGFGLGLSFSVGGA
jgi:hypothetical protein